jgi:DNA mismatch endonuclease, patch repair protein
MTQHSPGYNRVNNPEPSSVAARARMVRQKRSGTAPEVALRKELHRRGLRYRVNYKLPLPGVRRHADIVFTAQRAAVFVDGCYWHACPVHGTWPNASADWWRAKLEGNVRRDRDTDQRLVDAGWLSVRVWEHERPCDAANRIESALRRDT